METVTIYVPEAFMYILAGLLAALILKTILEYIP